MAEGGGLLNRYRVVKPYRGFESLRLRGCHAIAAKQRRRAGAQSPALHAVSAQSPLKKNCHAPILDWRRSSGYHHPHERERRVLVRVIRSRPFWSVLPLDALNPVMMLRGGSCYETNGYAGEAIFQFRRRPAETNLRFDGFTNNEVRPCGKSSTRFTASIAWHA